MPTTTFGPADLDRLRADHPDLRILDVRTPGEFAERLGLRVWLHVMVAPDELPRAVEVLSEAGYAARRNSRGLLVEVGAGEKGQALNALQHAGMDVIDVDVWR